MSEWKIGDVPVVPVLEVDSPALITYVHQTFHANWPSDDCPVEREPCSECETVIVRWGDKTVAGHLPGCAFAEE